MKYTPRVNQDIIYKSLESSFVTAILGARRVGKSTLVEFYANQHDDRRWIFLNMDKRSERQMINDEHLNELIEQRAERKIGQKEKLWIIIDEAQKCPAVFDQVKVIYDEFKDKDAIKFILTGSGFLSLHQLSAETLAGRIQLHRLHEFSLRETVQLHRSDLQLPEVNVLDALLVEKPIEKLTSIQQLLNPFKLAIDSALTEELIWGGLPEVLKNPSVDERINYLSDYLQTYLEKDIRALDHISDLSLYQHMMEIIAQQTGSIRNDKKILESLGCSSRTLNKYRGYLLATLMYYELFPYIKSSLGRLVKTPKGYLNNNGLISYLTNCYEPKLLNTSGLIGHRFENWLLKELKIWLSRNPKKSELYFWRLHGGVEVDFIVDKGKLVLPFEITYGKKADSKKVKHLKMFLEKSKVTPFGVYVYNGTFHYDSTSKIIFLPAWMLG